MEEKEKPFDIGRAADGPAEIVGAVVGGVWFILILIWWLAQPEGQGPGLLMAVVLMLLPLVLIGALVSCLRTLRALRVEAERLGLALDAARIVPAQTRPAAMRAEPARSKPVRSEPVRREVPPREEEPTLAFDAPEPEPYLTIEDYILAVNFPESGDDHAGIYALQMALSDRDTAKLIRAAQDVLTLLAQDGIYMDDLAPDPARPEIWRRFGAGERGQPISAVGAVRDRNLLTIAGQRMREDQIFRDAAHHFLRTFDRSFSGFEKAATDNELVALADTRTARAFMLLGRVAGTFD